MKYGYKYFRNGMPEWKRKKDPILTKLFYRRVSFLTSSICANIGIATNTVSQISILVAIVSSVLFLVNNYVVRITAAILVNLWIVLDCTDGNLARSVKSQLFGDFFDSISSYILVGFLCTCIGLSVYQTGGVIIESGCVLCILLGALTSSSDTMMRLIYQKYTACAARHTEEGLIPPENDKRTDHNAVNSLRVRIESEFGIGGILPFLILLGTIFNALDLVLLYCLAYYGLSFIAMFLFYMYKAFHHQRNEQ